MPEEYDNTNRGVLFKNQRKLKSWHSDWNGQGEPEGIECWANGFVRDVPEGDPREGEKMMIVDMIVKATKRKHSVVTLYKSGDADYEGKIEVLDDEGDPVKTAKATATARKIKSGKQEGKMMFTIKFDLEAPEPAGGLFDESGVNEEDIPF